MIAIINLCSGTGTWTTEKDFFGKCIPSIDDIQPVQGFDILAFARLLLCEVRNLKDLSLLKRSAVIFVLHLIYLCSLGSAAKSQHHFPATCFLQDSCCSWHFVGCADWWVDTLDFRKRTESGDLLLLASISRWSDSPICSHPSCLVFGSSFRKKRTCLLFFHFDLYV